MWLKRWEHRDHTARFGNWREIFVVERRGHYRLHLWLVFGGSSSPDFQKLRSLGAVLGCGPVLLATVDALGLGFLHLVAFAGVMASTTLRATGNHGAISSTVAEAQAFHALRYFPVYWLVPLPFDHGTVDYSDRSNVLHGGGPMLQVDEVELVTVSLLLVVTLDLVDLFGLESITLQFTGELLHRHIVKTTQKHLQRPGARQVMREKLPVSFGEETFGILEARLALHHQFYTIAAQPKRAPEVPIGDAVAKGGTQ